MAKVYKVAIIGCGAFSGEVYVPDLKKMEETELVAVCDIIPGRAEAYAARAEIPEWYTSLDDLLEKCDFDILIDAANIPAHHEINMKAILAGKHVFSQKPAGLTVEQITEQIEAARRVGVKIGAVPVHALRYANRMAKQMLADGVIGTPNTVRCHVAHGGPEYFQYREVDPSWFYQSDSGALFDMGIHALHYATDMLGPARRSACSVKGWSGQRSPTVLPPARTISGTELSALSTMVSGPGQKRSARSTAARGTSTQ